MRVHEILLLAAVHYFGKTDEKEFVRRRWMATDLHLLGGRLAAPRLEGPRIRRL